jgi:hypothetical protein
MHIPDPSSLDDDTWGEKIAHLKIIRKMEADAAKSQ